MWKTICRATLIIIPVQPLIYLYSRALDIIGEYICDDFVVNNTADPRGYARELVECAEQARNPVQEGMVLASTGPGKSELYQRVLRIVHLPHDSRVVANRRMYAGVTVVCCLTTLIIAVVGVKATAFEPEKNSAKSPTESLVFYDPEQEFFEYTTPSAPEPEYGDQPAPAEYSAGQAESGDIRYVETIPDMKSAITIQQNLPVPDKPEVNKEPVVPAETAASPGLEPVAAEPTALPMASAETAGIPIDESEPRMPVPVEPSPVENIASIGMKSGAYVGPEAIQVDIESFTSYDDCMYAGIDYFEQGRYFTALPLFKRALRFAPNDAVANYYVGCSYMETGDYAKAKMFLKIAIAIKSDFDLAYLRLGDVIQREGDLDGAWAQYKLAYNLNPALISEKKVVF